MHVEFVATGRAEDCGIATYTTSLQDAIDELDPGGGGDDAADDAAGGVTTSRIPLRLGSLNVLHYVAAAVRAGRSRADVVHVQHEYGIYGPKSLASWPFLLVLWLLTSVRGVPVVVTMHTAWSEETISPPLVGLKRVYVGWNNRLIAAVADHLLFLTEDERDRFARSAPVEDANTTVLPHGVPTDVRPMDEAAAKDRFGYGAETDLVVEPGFVRPEKGYETFFAIAAELPEAAFLVGGGCQGDAHTEYLDELRQEAPSNVEFSGVLEDEDFHALFEALDVAVLPYETVSQSGIVNWCVAYEVPIVATALERFRTLESEYGFPATFPAEDPAAGAERVREALEDPNGAIEEMAAYRTDHGFADVARKHRGLYERVRPPRV